MITLPELQRRLNRNSPDHLFDELLNGQTAYYFEDEFPDDHETQYERFKSLVGRLFGVQSNEVMLVGSARIGYSLNPAKHFRTFDTNKSDFDIAIVAPDAFDDLWDSYLRAHYRREGRSFESQFYALFRKFLTTDHLSARDPAYSRWEKRLGPLRRDVETQFYFGSSVNFRVYRDAQSLRLYHVDSFKTLKASLAL